MALPTSGQLTLAQIRDEFGAGTTSNVSLRTLSSAAGLAVPDGFNEFYGLSSFTPPTIRLEYGCYVLAGGNGSAASPYTVVFDSTIMSDLSEPGTYHWYDGGIGFTASSTGTYTMHCDFTSYSQFSFDGSNVTEAIIGASPFVIDSEYRNGTTSAAAMVALPKRTQTISVTSVPYYDFQLSVRFIQDYYDFTASITASVWWTV